MHRFRIRRSGNTVVSENIGEANSGDQLGCGVAIKWAQGEVGAEWRSRGGVMMGVINHGGVE